MTRSALDTAALPAVRTLVRPAIAGVIGIGAALLVDGLLPGGVLPQSIWPALWADLVIRDPSQTVVGVLVMALAGVIGAAVYTYGGFRRFVPAPNWGAGLAWGVFLWVMVTPILIPRVTDWMVTGGIVTAPAALAMSVSVFIETLVGLMLYGAIVGILGAPRGT